MASPRTEPRRAGNARTPSDTGAPGERHRLRVEIDGAVQGVGFRPHVYRRARELDLPGWVINDARGVRIEVEGTREVLATFLEALRSDPPPRAVIRELRSHWLDPVGFTLFAIRSSERGGDLDAAVLPDLATCPACRDELFDADDRRSGYPFVNCTDCGPRFSIIREMPYDRPHTTMAGFELCTSCAEEYESPDDRRFHAQPNACPDCGPQLSWNGERSSEAVAAAARALSTGRIVAAQGLGGFHLLCDARSETAVGRLRSRKGRPRKPLALMVPDLETARRICRLPPGAEALLEDASAPIVILEESEESGIAPSVAPGNRTLGLMLPYTPLHHLLLRAFGGPLVATSGNRSEEPICTDPAEARERLAEIADDFLTHDRPIERAVDDSVAWMVTGSPALLRRSRGYAPLPVGLSDAWPPTLAFGGQMKTTVGLARGQQAWLSQHIGDLDTPEAEEAFPRTVADLLRLYGLEPEFLAHDLHPDYRTTGWAAEAAEGRFSGVPGSPAPVPVQHHHAHLASLLAEQRHEGPALGLIWDGTGFGTDGTVWGGEFLLGDAGGVERVAHLREFRLPGGEAALRDPRRIALALLLESGLDGDAVAGLGFQEQEERILRAMVHGELRSPRTTSVGRLLDGFSALLDITRRVRFEGEAAISLEHRADPAERGSYRFEIRPAPAAASYSHFGSGAPTPRAGVLDRPRWVLDWEPALRSLLEDRRRGIAVEVVSARLHRGLVRGALRLAGVLGHPVVGLSGGCFQNRLLTEGLDRALRREGFEVLLHREVPPNDGGLALGQLAVAAARHAPGAMRTDTVPLSTPAVSPSHTRPPS